MKETKFSDTIFSSYLYVYGMCSEAFDFDPVKVRSSNFQIELIFPRHTL